MRGWVGSGQGLAIHFFSSPPSPNPSHTQSPALPHDASNATGAAAAPPPLLAAATSSSLSSLAAPASLRLQQRSSQGGGGGVSFASSITYDDASTAPGAPPLQHGLSAPARTHIQEEEEGGVAVVVDAPAPPASSGAAVGGGAGALRPLPPRRVISEIQVRCPFFLLYVYVYMQASQCIFLFFL